MLVVLHLWALYCMVVMFQLPHFFCRVPAIGTPCVAACLYPVGYGAESTKTRNERNAPGALFLMCRLILCLLHAAHCYPSLPIQPRFSPSVGSVGVWGGAWVGALLTTDLVRSMGSRLVSPVFWDTAILHTYGSDQKARVPPLEPGRASRPCITIP